MPKHLNRSNQRTFNLNSNGLFLLSNVEIERDAVVSGFELYADLPGKLAIDVRIFDSSHLPF